MPLELHRHSIGLFRRVEIERSIHSVTQFIPWPVTALGRGVQSHQWTLRCHRSPGGSSVPAAIRPWSQLRARRASRTSCLPRSQPISFLTVPVVSKSDASAVLAGLWLWHDALDESHAISQSLHTSTGSFWHAIMHRREGDFSNSKYWYARCRNHPALAEIASRAKPLLATLTDRALVSRSGAGGWDADAFVDWVEEVSNGSDSSSGELAIKLQQLEWHALFEHCTREAAGR